MSTQRRSAGLLVYRRRSVDPAAAEQVQVLLGHLGGPFWARRQRQAWSFPKGEPEPGEEPLEAARREFGEETGLPVPSGELLDLGTVRLSGGKQVTAWALAGDLDAAAAVSNPFTLQWPPRSGRWQQFPELDRFAWVDLATARELLVAGLVPFLDRLADRLAAPRR